MNLKLTELSLITKIAVLLSLLLLALWVIPTFMSYTDTLNEYKSKQLLFKKENSKYAISKDSKIFNIKSFKNDFSSLFLDMNISLIDKNRYKVIVKIEKEKLQIFHSFIETVALHYLINIEHSKLEFKEKDKNLEINFILKSF